jgi:alkanesulfonate monooxygenase SsuD/methylene tetrahydromethanopterin reductase-like flavin-dependent oxidoreductase (luciferase family)
VTGRIEFGFAATAVDAPGAPDSMLYQSLLAECERNRSLGFTTAWALEHHFSDYFPTPDILLLLANLAPRFPGMGLGTAVIVTPWHNPLRLAEQIAMLSVLGEGPLHLGLGRGTAKFEFDAFDTDMEESRQRFQESWEILQLALTGEPFSYTGEYCRVPREVRVRPRPARERLHFYGAIGSPASAEIMGRLGLAPICTSIGNMEMQAATIQNWKAAATERGMDTEDVTLPILVNCIVAGTDEAAVEDAKDFMPRYMQAQVDHYQVDVTPWENLKSYEAWKRIFDGTASRTDPENIPPWTQWQLIGSPETVVEKTKLFAAAGFNHFILHFGTPGVPLEARTRWATMFAREVAPAFAPASRAASAPQTALR